MATDHLQIPDVAASQNNKEVPINAAHNLLDRAINSLTQVTVTAADTFTTAETRESGILELVGTAGDTTVKMPDTNARYMRIFNNTNGVITILNSAGAGLNQPAVTVLGSVLFHYDGTDFLSISTGGGGGGTTITTIGTLDLYHVRDEKADGTDGGGSTTGTWNPRDLNTEVTTGIGGASLAANRITLPAGTYEVEASAQARDADTHRLRLQDITGASTLLVGQNADTDTVDTVVVQTTAHLFGRFTLTVQSDLELQHWTETGLASTGFGLASTDTGSVEVYADVRIRKVAPVRVASGLPFKGALVKLTGDETLTTTVPIPWDAEIYDIGDWFTLGSATRLTVPVGTTRVRLTASINMTAPSTDMQWHIEKNGARVEGGGLQRDDATALSITYVTGIMEVVAGDFFELVPTFGSGSPVLRSDIFGATHFSTEAIEAIAPSMLPRGALVRSSGNQSTANGVFEDLDFDLEEYDTDDIHDTSVNNTRMTIPAGVTHVRLTGNVEWAANSTGGRIIRFMKNGAIFEGSAMSRAEAVTGNPTVQNIASGVLEVNAGDFLELEVLQDAGTLNVLSGPNTWLAMEIVEPAVVAGGAGRESMWIPAALMRPSVTAGCAVLASDEVTAGQPDKNFLGFDGAADEHAQFVIALPKRWNLGTVTFQAFWSHPTGNTGGLDGVAWALQGVSLADDDAFGTAYGTPEVVSQDGVTDDDLYVTLESAPITIAGSPVAGELQAFRVFRDVSHTTPTPPDDLDVVDAQLMGIKLFWTSDKSTDD